MCEPVLNLRPMRLAPPGEDRAGGKTVGNPDLSPVPREQYRQLAAALHNAQEVSGIKAVMIASAVGGEGKTLTAANLALTFAESYQRTVLLVDADLRRPSLHHLFAADSQQQSGTHMGSGSWANHVRRFSPRLAILTSDRPASSPLAELTSTRMRQFIEEARRTVDWIVVDTPPIALLPDATLLAPFVDGAVIVVKAGSTPLELVKRAVEALDPRKTLGVVLNGASPDAIDSGYGYEEYYTQTQCN
jgi:protein-tyrosine kinase